MLLISLSLVVISLPLSSILQGSMHAQRPVASHRVRLLVFLIQLGLDRNRFTTISSVVPSVAGRVPSVRFRRLSGTH